MATTDVILPTSPGGVTDALTFRRDVDTKSLWLDVTRSSEYAIFIEHGAIEHLGALLEPTMEQLESRSVVIVTDDEVERLHLPAVARSLDAEHLPWEVLTVPAGEKSKSVPTLVDLWEACQRLHVERRTMMLALGGGVLCDLVGFLGATYMRGIPYANVPTTLMAQVDAAIGGKVAVDSSRSKNLIGAFYHPTAVVADPAVLATLPRREVVSGLAEVVKIAVIGSPGLFERLEALELGESPPVVADVESLTAIIEEAIVLKLELLADDPFERSLRRLLNLGHSIGHAVEAATQYTRYRHGEAVAIGLAAAAQIAVNVGACRPETRNRIVSTLGGLGLPSAMPSELWSDVWSRVQMIRRIRNGDMHFVLPVRIGHCTMIEQLPESVFYDAMSSLELASA